MDVTVKGLFWLLEEFRQSPTARQFVLIGGDAGVGHFFYRHDGPVTEAHAAHGLSRLLRAVEGARGGDARAVRHPVRHQLDCCLRAPWIMEKDDFRYTLSFGDDVFGGPDWKTLVPDGDAAALPPERHGAAAARRRRARRSSATSSMSTTSVAAILAALDNPRAERQLFNICMDGPVDYGEVAAYLKRDARPRFDRHPEPVPLDLDGQHQGQVRSRLAARIRPAKTYRRRPGPTSESPDDPRKVWYPG